MPSVQRAPNPSAARFQLRRGIDTEQFGCAWIAEYEATTPRTGFGSAAVVVAVPAGGDRTRNRVQVG
jgi:hypothetical protein